MTHKRPEFIKEEILRKTKFKTTTEGKYKRRSTVEEESITIRFYPDEIIIDYQESTNLRLNNKYIPRLIKLLEQHLKETEK